MTSSRTPAVAGMFYSADADKLRYHIKRLLQEATPTTHQPKALIIPHAGYVYSGAVAASGYQTLQQIKSRISKVVLLGPAHRVPVQGIALPQHEYFASPLGLVPLETDTLQQLAELPGVHFDNHAHLQEHSLEVHLPFLQHGLENFTLTPLLIGNATPHQVAEVLDMLWGGEETLIVISSDLSHFHPYATAEKMDRHTCDKILKLQPGLNGNEACGCRAINGLTLLARQRKLNCELLDLRNSGDTAGDKKRVVGYASFALTPGDTR